MRHRSWRKYSLPLLGTTLALLLSNPAVARPSSTPLSERDEVLVELRDLRNLVNRLQSQTKTGKDRKELERGLEALSSRLTRLERTLESRRGRVVANHPSHVVVGARTISPASFASLRRSIANQHFSRDRLAVIATATRENWFDVTQVRFLLLDLRYADVQLDALRLLWPRVVDRGNGFLLHEVFTFEKDRKAASKILES